MVDRGLRLGPAFLPSHVCTTALHEDIVLHVAGPAGLCMHNACSHRAPLLAFGGDINVKSHIKEEKIVILGLKTSGFTKMGFLTFALLK